MSRRRLPAAPLGAQAPVEPASEARRAILQLPPGVLPALVPHQTPLAPEAAGPSGSGASSPQPHLRPHPRRLGRHVRRIYGRHALIFFALLFLLAGAAIIKLSGDRWLANTIRAQQPATQAAAPGISGLNIKLPAAELDTKLKAVTGQPAVITVGEKPVNIPADKIRDWLGISHNKDKSEYYLRVKTDVIAASLLDIANQHIKPPVDQVTATHDGVAEVIVAGKNGVGLVNPDDLKIQAGHAAKTLLDGKGLQFYAPTQTQAFATLTPADFDKLIEVDIVTKQMYLYEKGKLAYHYPISAGAPETPTPIGQYKIYAKLTSQDMSGLNADGSPYFQPRVRWVNYFLRGGYAIHGNYWRPTSWFGNINSSHGCVSLPDYQAKVVYDWAPIGTTIITHY